jgi:glycopeptide antibiotics resistance protein
MSDKTKGRMPTGQVFTSLAGGLALYLTPQDSEGYSSLLLRGLYIAGLAALITLLLLLLFHSYETVGLALAGVILLVTVRYLGDAVRQIVECSKTGASFVLSFDYYGALFWGIVWFTPFALCVLIRLCAGEAWDTPQKRREFGNFFVLASASFYVFYGVLLLFCFLFVRPVDLYGVRSVNLTPFAQILRYFSGMENGLLYFVGNLLFFTPLGFFLSARYSWPLWKHSLFILGTSVGIELIQFALNSGYVDIDDVLLNVAGYFFGCLIKWLLNQIRNRITAGEESEIAWMGI